MKRYLFVIVHLFFIYNVYSQEFISQFIDECIALVGNPVPRGFQNMGRGTYRKIDNDGIVVQVRDGLIVTSVIGAPFEMSNDASSFNALFYKYFDNNWTYYRESYNGDIYTKNGMYAMIYVTTKRDDGYIVAMISFAKSIDTL
jgi:hypothetical protein